MIFYSHWNIYVLLKLLKYLLIFVLTITMKNRFRDTMKRGAAVLAEETLAEVTHSLHEINIFFAIVILLLSMIHKYVKITIIGSSTSS